MLNRSHALHPGRTPAQRRALDAIGCGNDSPVMANSTRDALLRAGLIEPLSDQLVGGGALRVRVARFEMPVSVHMRWCEAMAAEASDA